MKKFIYALRDVKTHWTDPFVAESDDDAKRGVALMVRNADPNSLIGFQARDFDLYVLGEYDTSSGIIDPNCDHVGSSYPMFIGNSAQIYSQFCVKGVDSCED